MQSANIKPNLTFPDAQPHPTLPIHWHPSLPAHNMQTSHPLHTDPIKMHPTQKKHKPIVVAHNSQSGDQPQPNPAIPRHNAQYKTHQSERVSKPNCSLHTPLEEHHLSHPRADAELHSTYLLTATLPGALCTTNSEPLQTTLNRIPNHSRLHTMLALRQSLHPTARYDLPKAKSGSPSAE